MVNTSEKRKKTTTSENNLMRQDKPQRTYFLEMPYKGLEPFSEEDSKIFCCRERDIERIITKLKLWKFNILYGKSGVGKSSLVHAGIVHNLLKKAKENIIDYGYPKLAVVVFPLEEEKYLSHLSVKQTLEKVKEKIEEQIKTLQQEIYEQEHLLLIECSLDSPTNSLSETIQKWSEKIQGTIYFIFDQFEANFFEDEGMENSLTQELIHAITSSTIPLHSLVVIRKDFLADLDCFKGKIDELFDHRLELKTLSREQAEKAITEPLETYNKNTKETSLEALKVDEDISELCKAIFCEGQVGDEENEPIELLLLQLVMKSIWEEEVKQCNEHKKSKIFLKKETFDNLGKTQGIAEKHLRNSLSELAKIDELKTCKQLEFILAVLFQALVSAAARKIPRTIEELEQHPLIENFYKDHNLQSLTHEQLELVLDKLAEFRILRKLPKNQYEIFHEVFCQVILAWTTEKLQELEKRKTQRELNQYTLIAQNLAFQASQKHQNREYDLSLSLAYESYHFSQKNPGGQGNGIIHRVLRELLEKPDVFTSEPLLPPHNKEVSVVAFSPKGKWLASGSYDCTVHIYKTNNLEQKFLSLDCYSSHFEGIHALAFDEEEKKLAVGSHYGNVYLADLTQDNPPLDRLYSHEDDYLYFHEEIENDQKKIINSIAFSPDGKYLASGSTDRTVEIFDLENLRVKHTLRHKDWIWSVAFNPKKSQQLAVGCRNGTVILYDLHQLDQGKPKAQTLSIHVAPNWYKHNENILREREILCVAFSPDGHTLAAGGRDTIIRLWDLEHLSPDDQVPKVSRKLIGHQNMVQSLSFSPDGLMLASGSDDKNIRIWYLSEEKPLSMVLKTQSVLGISSLAFNPNPNKPMLVSGSWDNSESLTQNQISSSQVPNVLLWHWEKEKLTSLRELKGHEGVVKAVAFSKNDQYLVSTGYDKTVKRWTWKDNLPGEEQCKDFLPKPPKEQRTLAINQENSLIAAAGIDGIVRVWDINTPDQLKYPLSVEEQEVRSLAFSPDGQWLASGGSQKGARYLVHLWKYVDQNFIFQGDQSEKISNTLRCFGEKTNTNPTVRSLSFSPNNQWLLTGGEDQTLHLWNTNDYHQNIHSEPFLGAIIWIAFSPDEKWMAAATEKENIRLWRIREGSQPKFDPDLWTELRGGCLAFSPNSQILASGGHNGVICLWDLQQLKTPPILLKGHKHGIRGLSFSHDSQYLASGSDDQTIRIWVVETSKLAEMVKERLQKVQPLNPDPILTREEWKKFVGNDVPYPH
ncbi:MAG: hypothetical protein QNJ42_06195 [Crocosphaera sp.]|nr:hypothetical protein [Crocosphaera sp.]